MTRPRTCDPALLLAVHDYLSTHAVGRENAVTWDDLLHRVNGYPYSLDVREVRRLQEAASALRCQCPIVGVSRAGVFWAASVDELEEAIGERRRRALTSLREFSKLKRIRAEMMGQGSLRAVGGGR